MAVAAMFALTHCAMADVVTNDVSDVVSLTNALKNATAGCVIRLAKGVYDVSSLSDDQAPLSTSGYGHSLLVLGQADMQLIGATGKPEDVVIKAVNSDYRMFNLSGARSMLRNVTIMGGNASSTHIATANYRSGGGALFISDSASVSNCVFTGNKAALRGGAVAGVFNNRYGTVYDSVFYGNNDQTASSMVCDRTTIRGCTFTNNVAVNSANTICLVSNSRVYDSTFANNKAPLGCVVGGDTYASIVDGCRFLHNTATYGYGAATRHSTVSNSYFYGNVAKECGGAINGGTVSFCTVVSNRTELLAVNGKTIPYGGGIYGATLVEGCLVASNVCYNGGGMSNCTLVRDTTNVCNLAMKNGGGAYNSALERCIIERNVARGSGLDMNIGGGGAGIYGGSATNCVFRDNSCSAALDATSLYKCDIADTSVGAASIESCVIHGLRNDPRPRAVGNVGYPEGHVASNLYMFGVSKLMRNCLVTNCTWQPLAGSYVNPAVFYQTVNGITSRVENCTFVDNNYYYLSRNVSASKALVFVNTVLLAGETPNSLGDIRDFTKTGSCLVLSNCVCGVASRPSDATKAAGFEDGKIEAIGSFANARFIGTGDYPLTPGRRSPLRGSGLVLDWMSDGTDLAENPRLSDGGVDIGCYQHVPKENGFIVILL